MPESTSPVPPLASPGFSNGATAISPVGDAITVRAPFSTTTWPHARAASAAAAARAASSSTRSPSAAGSRPDAVRSRANSPAWGVITARRRTPVHHSSIEASERNASASSSTGGPAAASAASDGSSGVARIARISSVVARPGRSPGPITSASWSWSSTRASASSGSTSSTSSSGRAMVVASSTRDANNGWSDSGTASVTRPAPARPADRTTRIAAPA